MRAKLLLAALSLLAALALGELAARSLAPDPFSYELSLEEATPASPERLFPPGYRARFDAAGLYEGAGEIVLRVSARRLLEPDPQGSADRRVLFVGGSTTESLYLPEERRWVAQLGEPGRLATHNAGISGANTLDAHFNFLFFTRQGMRFDLVVLSTMNNDFGWMRKLAEVGGDLTLPDYHRYLTLWRFHDARREHRREIGRSLWGRVGRHLRLLALVRQALGGTDAERGSRVLAVAQWYRDATAERIAEYESRAAALGECAEWEKDLERFAQNERRNLSLLARAVEEHGARLLVLSEATSYGAPPESFFEDFREPMPCGRGLLSHADAARAMAEIKERYLVAAKEAGALTFDVAAQLPTNGPEGGRYMYDMLHFTPQGSDLMAQSLAPAIGSVLEGRGILGEPSPVP